ncbi:MAG: F0F1 ATP synthase subunit B [Acidobacteria bacterium]|nr:F0F1 ATP synthase subunit B [Acidobacteriota bacterium]
MLIDWFTVVAQVLNFLILVWLMKRFLYRPVLQAIEAREARIAAELAHADATRADASSERKAFERRNAEFDQQRGALVRQATAAAEAERVRLVSDARKAAEAESARRMDLWKREADTLTETLRRRTQQEVFAIARQALTDLASTSLEERVSEVFTRRLLEMDGPAKARLAESLEAASDTAVVRSAYDLPAAQRDAIQRALNEVGAPDVHVRFETAPDLVSGIELTTNGQKVGWNISDYLASMEKAVGDLMTQREGGENSAAPRESQVRADAGHA